jgi:hypothetical protein
MVILTRKGKTDMKATVATLAVCGFTCLNLAADDMKKPYVIRRGDDILVVSNMPTFTVSDPITNSFVYIDGEYVVPPYIVSVSNLAVCINGYVVQDCEPMVHARSHYSRRIGVTPESVGKSVDDSFESYTGMLRDGTAVYLKNGSLRRGYAIRDGDGGALAHVERAKKAMQGNEIARAELINEMRLDGTLPKVRPDWIQRLAGNTNLEVRATRILEAKRQRDQHEREKREQMEREWREQKERRDGNAHP